MSFVASKSASRLWHVCKEAGRSWPQLDDDDVIDFMIMEAVALSVAKETKEVKKQEERTSWRNDKEGLDRLRNLSKG